MLLLYFANFNKANKKLKELFDESYFTNKEIYNLFIKELDLFFRKEKTLGEENHDLFTFFKTPLMENPDDHEAQLNYMFKKWKVILSDRFLRRILSGRDLIREDQSLLLGGGGPAPTAVPWYKEGEGDADTLSIGKSGYKYASDSHLDYIEEEKFTPDIDWMPRVVIMAKNTYVWLDQLSKKYRRPIRRLDQIPDEELDQLAKRNFTGLWLIGLWERSTASKKIKHIMGNIDAVASAYSLYDYIVAEDLGGEEAYKNLNRRARERGIRLASDMVPNHTGIFSKWVLEHPEYFIQSDNPPFPNYSFTGADLSDDPGMQIRIEDGYWSKSDAAVVFQRIDNSSGKITYMYHGNDGTNMPWNDTAQLNILIEEVREQVIQKIFEVARRFSIIRFDAAMTLTKRHFSRLWYPQPGKGGDIPSRSDYALTAEEFNKFFPKEFWREVVDRINEQMPDTLLLAEAFWLMEGYFVRTLGMHRVYNSAFMNMLMREENEKYRDLITNTLEFEPEILKRYVNFMSNPDEETAIKQFGTDDKYFGVSAMMVTLPGLPMFAHGQVEGFTEKYGMEYKRAYYNETPNEWLINRHEKEIFPLMKKRYLFSQVINFWFYDVIDHNGHINEDVFAYSNSYGSENGLVFFNNKFSDISGSINWSAPKLDSVTKELRSVNIADALKIRNDENIFYIFREHISGLEYIRPGSEFHSAGFPVDLGAFKYKIFLRFTEVYDHTGEYKKIYESLGTKGVASISTALDEMRLKPVHDTFRSLFEPEEIEILADYFILVNEYEKAGEKTRFIYNRFYYLLNSIKNYINFESDIKPSLGGFKNNLLKIRYINQVINKETVSQTEKGNKKMENAFLITEKSNYKENSIIFLLWLTIVELRNLFEEEGLINRDNFSAELMLSSSLRKVLEMLGRGYNELYYEILLINILLDFDNTLSEQKEKETTVKEKISGFAKILEEMLEEDDVRTFIGVNRHGGTIYYSKEKFEEMVSWLSTIYLIEEMSVPDDNKTTKYRDILLGMNTCIGEVFEISSSSGYRFEVLKKMVGSYCPRPE